MIRRWLTFWGLIIMPLILIAQSQNVEDQFGARPLGMGRTFVAIADDGNAPYWNPAGMSFITGKERIATGMYSRLFMGIDNDALGEGFLSYLHHYEGFGSVGLSLTHFYSNIYTESSFNLSYAVPLSKKLSVGLNGRMLMNAIDESGFVEGIDGPMSSDPLLDKSSIYGFTGGVGFMYKPKRNLSFGLNAANLNQPEMTWLESGDEGYNQDALDASKVPMTLRLGGAYTYHNYLTFALDFRYSSKEINGGNQFKPYGGLEYWFSNKTVALRSGANPEEYSFGFSYRSKQFLDMQIDYAFIYPLTEIRKAGVTSHKLSLSLRFLPPPKPLFDLELTSDDMTIYPQNAIIEEEITITAIVRNIGEKSVDDYTVSIYYEDPEKGIINAAAPQFIEDKLDVDEEKEITFKWIPYARGTYQFFARVDDDGSMLPDFHSVIDEVDELNNEGSIKCKVFPLPEGSISPLENVLTVNELKLIREEEPVVPVFFFKPGQHRVDSRFQHLIEVLSSRLIDNPDIELNVMGYYSPEDDAAGSSDFGESLAEARAKAVRSNFFMYNNEVVDQLDIVAVNEYEPQVSRSGKTDDFEDVPEEDIIKKIEENRRVELRPVVKGFENFDLRVYFDKNKNEADVNALAALKTKADQIKKVMERNPEVIFLLTGSTTESESKPVELGFDRAEFVKAALGDILGNDFMQKFKERIFIKPNTDYTVDQGRVDIALSGESLIFRPLEGTMAAEGQDLVEDQMNFVNITSNVEAGVAKYKITIVDKNGDDFVVLDEGSGPIPDGVPWDWKDADGNLINPSESYRCRLDIEDKLGQSITEFSDAINVEVEKRQQLLETLVLVQHTFDEKISESPFLESRVELVARKLIEKAEEPKTKLTAVVGGHTDIIGMDRRNKELSKIRARKQEVNLRRYLIHLLALDSNNELNKWLKAHNTELTSEGYADAKPYIIDKWVDGALVTMEIGKNDLPEGRTINRRVVIEFFTEKNSGDLQSGETIKPQSKR